MLLLLHDSLKGAWETKISNREKRQQRKKEKGSNDESGSPGGGQHVGQQMEQPALTAPVNSKKNKGKLFEDLALIILTWLQQWITFYPNKYLCVSGDVYNVMYLLVESQFYSYSTSVFW